MCLPSYLRLMTNIDLTVVTPLYNSAVYLRKFLHSLKRQSGVAFEFIVVDDGSTDGSSAILEEVARSDDRLIILRQRHAGSSAARNAAMTVARGEWITFADCDDWLSPDTFSTRLAWAKTSMADVVICNGFQFTGAPADTGGKPILHHQPWGETISGWEWIQRAARALQWPHYVWLQLIRRDFLQLHGMRFEEGLLHQDIIWTIELALTNGKFSFIPERLYGYRQNPASVTNDQSQDTLLARAGSYVRVIERIVQLAAEKPIDPPVERALLHQVNRESRHFLGLLRRKIKDPKVRGRLALNFLSLRLHRAVLAGSQRPHELWHAVRCVVALKRYAASAHLDASAARPGLDLS
jgi:glycosyltransferase involved in cell wall biosynthesis